MKIIQKLFTVLLLLGAMHSYAQSAGPDQTICITVTPAMAATGIGSWLQVSSNPAGASLDDPFSDTSLVYFSNYGTYGFIWATASGNDTMTITVNGNNNNYVTYQSTYNYTCGAVALPDTFYAIPTAPGSSPVYHWYKNGAIVGTNSTTYIDNNLTNGDSMWVTMASSLTCPTPDVASSPHMGIRIMGSGSATISVSGGACLGSDSLTLNTSGAISNITWYNGASQSASFTTGPSTVAGGDYLSYNRTIASIRDVFVDRVGYIWVSDYGTYSIKKFPPNSNMLTQGVIVAGGNGRGSAANQLWDPSDIFVDSAGSLYVADGQNYRIQKFPAGSTSATNGITVAGGNGSGTALNQLGSTNGLYVDKNGYIYVGETNSYGDIKRFPPGSTSSTNGVIIIGGNGAAGAHQSIYPSDITGDAQGNLYVCHQIDNAVLRFPPNVTPDSNGVLVAGGWYPNQLGYPFDISLDSAGNLYVLERNGVCVMKFPPGSDSTTIGTLVAGTPGSQGHGANQLYYPIGMSLDRAGNIYVAETYGGYVQKWSQQEHGHSYTPVTPGTYTARYTSSVGCTSTLSNGIAVSSCGNAGPDQVLSCVILPGGQATMAATGIGAWSAVVGNPGVATITTPSSATTTITTFIAVGIYSFVWTPISGLKDTVKITVTGKPNAGTDHTVSCAVLPGGTATMAATGVGTWTAMAGNPGTATITTPTSPTTTITNYSTAGVYYFIWANAGCTDTAMVTVTSQLPAPAISMRGTCVGSDTISAHVPAGTVNINWMLNGVLDHTSLATDSVYIPVTAGTYTVIAVPAGVCASPSSNAVQVILCLSDSVWPGDADHNGIADNNDLLPIGVAYGLNGPVRPGASIVWRAETCQNWSLQLLNGTNIKHADCNGDGTINANDTTAIIQNFGLTHNKTNGSAPWRTGIPALRAILSADSLYEGDTLTVTFVLGDSVLPVNNIYGLAWTYNFDPLVVDSSFTTMSIGSSWLGGADKISISKTLNGAGQIKAALTRIDHTIRSGNGAIAVAKFKITTDNISGKDFAYYANVGFISDITAIDNTGVLIQINEGADTMQVGYEPTGIREIANERISIYPNPATDRITITADNAISDIVITNTAGQNIYQNTKVTGRTLITDISKWSEGIYFIHVTTSKGTGIAKLSIVR